MEKSREAGSWEQAVTRGIVLAACIAAAQAAVAQDATAEATRGAAPMRVEIATSALPRLDAQDSGFQGPRVDLSMLPANGGLGVAVGMSNSTPRNLTGPAFAETSRTNVDLGLRWRDTVADRQVDVTAWRRVNAPDAATLAQQNAPLYGARVEMKLAPATSRFGADKGAVGFQLESGARIAVRRKDGRPMVYYRNTF